RESVHDVRKRCKKLRAITRIVRPHIGRDRFRASNAAFRDAARQLSGVRDAQVIVQVLDDLVATAPAAERGADLDAGRADLEERGRPAIESLMGRDGGLRRAHDLIEDGLEQVQTWEIDDDFDSLAGGIAKTYGRAASARRAAEKSVTTERLHEWRKRAKYHWYHLRLLCEASPRLLTPWADRLHDLTDVLGDDHDLAVLIDVLHDNDAFADVEAIVALAEARRGVLQRKAFSLGARLTAEDPDAVVDRLRVQWEAFREHGPPPRARALS
ncbi:MAG: CHAD domain-containing protein, partial [Actinomycetota bacterium]